MSYLLGITIGPVQTYIEESRKLRDLYNSSRIISDIMKKIYKYILAIGKNPEIIYPNHEGVDGVDYSNYMIFEIEDIIDLRNIEEKIYSEIEENYKNDIPNYKNELKDVFHLFWAIEEISNEYSGAYENLTRLIRSIKNTYEFGQVIQPSQKKCLICGKRNTVTQSLQNSTRRNYNLNSDEELCQACLLKRIYKKEEFKAPSVYSIAIRNWKLNNEDRIEILTNKLQQLFLEIDKYYNPNEINNIIKILEVKKVSQKKKQLNSNKDKKSEEDIVKKLEKIKCELKNQEIENTDKFTDIKEVMNSIYDNENIEHRVQLPNYEYCFIQFDIDNLGRWMSGKYLDKKSDLKKEQKKLSNVLINFSKELREKLKYTNCDVIYSGGDDFLGVLPNEEIIHVMRIIDEIFQDKVRTEIKDMTYSASVTIAQCKDPMSYALNKTRIELENVKNRYEKNEIEKNGLAINYIINNGKEITAYLEKDDLKSYFKLINEFENVKSKLSFSYINNFENEFLEFKHNDISFEEWRSFIKIAMYELKRLIGRAKIKKDEEEKTEEYIERLLNFIEHIIYENSRQIKSNHKNIDFKNIINVMKIYQKLCSNTLRLNEGGE